MDLKYLYEGFGKKQNESIFGVPHLGLVTYVFNKDIEKHLKILSSKMK